MRPNLSPCFVNFENFHRNFVTNLTFQRTLSQVSNPPKMNYDKFLNKIAQRRKPSLIRELTKKLATAEPGTIFLAGGLPNPALFPFQSLSVKLGDSPEGAELTLGEKELKAALQYQPTMGYPPLQAELKKVVKHFFNPPANFEEKFDLIVTVGSQNALWAVLEMTLEPGDGVVIPKPVYSAALTIMDPFQPNYLPVEEDKDGMQPKLLEKILDQELRKGGTKPKLLYVNPTGSNPSGIVIPTGRKKEIYEIARKHDLLILEDDPYYFLHFQDEEPETFLSMDVDGRVIRFDSFSKVLSSGLRVGFATGPKDLIRRIELTLQASVLHAASLSQVLVHGVLSNWGVPGLVEHTKKVKAFYKRRRDIMVASAQKHLSELADWNVPQGGMFLWLKLRNVPDTYEMVMERGTSKKIMMLPGREFMARREDPCPYLRASFSVVEEDKIDEGIQRLAILIKEEQDRIRI